MPSTRRPRDGSVARQVLLLQVLIVLVLVLSALALAAYDARRDVRADATDRAVAVARTVADSPTTLAALSSPDPSADLQPYAERVRVDTGVDFVVIMDLDRTRYSHPTPARIGEEFIGDLGDAPEGGVFTQEYTGTLGPSMRAVVPVFDGDRAVALVSVGITLDHVRDRVRNDLLLFSACAVVVLAMGMVGAWLVSRRLRRQTHGLGEREITRMYEYYSAVLHAVREGLLLLDRDGVVQLVNDEARRLLSLPGDVVGRKIHDLGLPSGLVDTATGDVAESDEIYVAGDHVVLVSSSPAAWAGHDVGAVVTLRDHTELRAVTGELDVARSLTEALRTQTHEAANRLHAVVSLIELGRPDEAVTFATEELEIAQELADRMVGAVGDPVLAALLLGKTAEASERGIGLAVTGELPASASAVPSRDLVTIVGNLVDNALDAVADADERRVRVELSGSADQLRIRVEDSGPGITDDEARRVLERGWTSKAVVAGQGGRGVGLALVSQAAGRHRGSVQIVPSSLGGAAFVVTLEVS